MLSVDEAERLRASLPSALEQEAAEVVVVDNASTDGTSDLARAGGARVVRLDGRRSYAAAMNAGFEATRAAGAVLLLNADCVLEAGALAALVECLERDPDAGAVAPKLLRADGVAPAERLERIDAAGMWIDRRRKNGTVGHDEPASRYAERAEAFGADGACALLRRAAIDDVAPDGEVLDETLALWASDADLMWRLRLRGWRAWYEPRAVGWHVRFYSPTNRGNVAAEHRRLQFRNRLLMMAKNDAWADVRRDLPRIAAYEVLALGHALLRERALLGAYRDALRALPVTRRRRRAVQARRTASAPFGLRPPA